MKLALVVLFAGFTPGCKLAVVIVEGGEVQSEDWGTCVAGTICIIDVTDTNFAETFYAVPDEGWYFHKWNAGDRLLCGNSANTACQLSFDRIPKTQALDDLVASSEVFYLMPVFKDYPRATLVEGKPGAITVDGEEWQWLQPGEFVGYSYDQIREVCPKGICRGVLPGGSTDLSGYVWASSDDASLLFLAYQHAGRSIFADFDYTLRDAERIIYAVLSDPPLRRESENHPGETDTYLYVAQVWEDRLDPANDFRTITEFPADLASATDIGPWFYRPVD